MILKPLTDHKWNGYNFDELQEQLVINQARIIMTRKSLDRKVSNIKETSIGDVAADNSRFGRVVSLVELVVTGVAVFRRLKPLFKKKKV